MFFCCCNFELIIRVYKTKLVISLKKNYIFIVLVDLYASLSRFFFWYPDPDQHFQGGIYNF